MSKGTTRLFIGLLLTLLLGLFVFQIVAQNVQPFIDTPTGGTWQGTAYFGPQTEQLAAPIAFNVGAEGVVGGTIQFHFRYEGMPEDLIQLIDTYGCIARFDALTPESAPVAGYFMDASRAVGTFSVSACYLEGYGDLTFRTPVSGVWYAEHGEPVGLVFEVQPTALSAPSVTPAIVEASPTSADSAASNTTTVAAGTDADYDPAVMALGVEVFLQECSECHGVFGEGGPGVADLTDRKVTRMSEAKLMEIINLGVEGTEMAPWGVLLSEEEKQAIILLIRNPAVLHEQQR